MSISASVAETGHAADTVTKGNTPALAVTITESGAATDHPSAASGGKSGINLSVAERGVANDNPSAFKGAAGTYNLTVAETGSASDVVSLSSRNDVVHGGIRFWGYQYLYIQGFSTASVWCCGLDCGDHIVEKNGSIFVPWLSDPDGLFTPGFVIQTAASPPFGGFAELSCLVDLNYAGSIQRLTIPLWIGLAYNSDMQPLRPDTMQDARTQSGPSTGETRRQAMYAAKLSNSGPYSIGQDSSHLLQVVYRNPANSPYLLSAPFSGVYWDSLDSDYDFEGGLFVRMTRPYPMTLTSLGGFLHTSERLAA